MPFIEKISGGPASYTLRHRVFNLFLFFGGVAGLLDLVIRTQFHQHLNQIVFALLISGVFAISYYIVRVRGIFSVATILISAVIILGILSFSFFFNSGTDGKVIPLILCSLTIYFLVTQKSLTYYISVLHIISIIAVLVLQYFHPEWIVDYPNERERLIDNLANIAYIVLIMYFILSVLRNEFEKERENVRKKDSYLSQQNVLIQDLLKELNHRVKNNLQVISALLSLQAYRSQNSDAVSALEEGKNRLVSMSILHKKLYQDNFFNQISLAEYIDDLIDHSLSGVDEPIKVKKDIEDIMLTADQAIPLGLILNEIFTDIRNHAFENHALYREMEIHSELDHSVVMVFIKDNGIGSSEKASSEKKSVLSMELIDMLIKQLDGTCEICNDPSSGTEIRIKFALEY